MGSRCWAETVDLPYTFDTTAEFGQCDFRFLSDGRGEITVRLASYVLGTVVVDSYPEVRLSRADLTIEIGPSVPVALTHSAERIGQSGAILHGEVKWDGDQPCKYRFLYGRPGARWDELAPTDWTDSVITGQGFSGYVHDLTPARTYVFYAQLKNSAGESDDAAGPELFTTESLDPRSPNILPTRSIQFAKAAIGAPYLGDGETWGGKGYNCSYDPENCRETPLQVGFVNVEELKVCGYYFHDGTEPGAPCSAETQAGKRTGIDCSGLVYWAYNKAYYGDTTGMRNEVQDPMPHYCEAGQLSNKCTDRIDKEDILPGDILIRSMPGEPERVAMYVGPFEHD